MRNDFVSKLLLQIRMNVCQREMRKLSTSAARTRSAWTQREATPAAATLDFAETKATRRRGESNFIRIDAAKETGCGAMAMAAPCSHTAKTHQ